MPQPLDIVKLHLERWKDDPAGAMSELAPDMVYCLNVAPDALSIGGETVGREAVGALMLGVREVFEYLVYIPRILSVEGDTVRSRIEMILLHKPSGELLMGHMRSEFVVRDGRIVRVDEFVDAPMIETFMRFFSPPERQPQEQGSRPH